MESFMKGIRFIVWETIEFTLGDTITVDDDMLWEATILRFK
jgi:hypothetical protein